MAAFAIFGSRALTVKDAKDEPVYFSGNNGGVRILDAKAPLIQQKKPVTINLAADNFPALDEGQTVVFKYMPIRENSEFSMNWEITKEVYDAFNESSSSSGSSGASEPDASTTA